jgi:ornithine carbamoyltransferase
VLERWVDAVVIRTFSQRLLAEFEAAAPRPHAEKALLATLLSPARRARRDQTQP